MIKANIQHTINEEVVKIMIETKQEIIYPLKVYMKLGWDKLIAYNGRRILELYNSFLKEKEEA